MPPLSRFVVMTASLLFNSLSVKAAATEWNSDTSLRPEIYSTALVQSTDADPRVGTKVLITKAGAELKTPKEVVWRAYLGEVFTVKLVNGEWLWIDEKGGWLWEQETLPFDTAIAEATQRIEESKTAENYHLRGVAYLAHNLYQKAIEDFTLSLQHSPRDAGALNNRGKCHYALKDYSAAIADFSSAVDIDPGHFYALNNRALAYIATDQLHTAAQDLNAALQMHPEYPEALNNRGVVHQKQNRTSEAIQDFTAALKIDPRFADAYGNRSFSYRGIRDFSNAIKDLQNAMQVAPDSYKPVNDLAWILCTADSPSVRNRSRALTLAQKACEMTEYKDWNTLDTLAAAMAENGDFEGAAKWIAKAMEYAPTEQQPNLAAHQQLIAAGKPIRE